MLTRSSITRVPVSLLFSRVSFPLTLYNNGLIFLDLSLNCLPNAAYSSTCNAEFFSQFFYGVKRLDKGTSITWGRWSKEEESSSEQVNEGDGEYNGDSNGEFIGEGRKKNRGGMH
ncbi:unnamed protein product [Cuscuta campestris]|uniref:Uncharacterized protein n=1 Tax=Cuscuta campestris TaxID=132261 RepID=A0A484M9B5_9ASTE|nr:unnamed protein product [Cuscuta campestris]